MNLYDYSTEKGYFLSRKKPESLLREALKRMNWHAIFTPDNYFRCVAFEHADGAAIEIRECPDPFSYMPGDVRFASAHYGPDGAGTPSIEQSAYINSPDGLEHDIAKGIETLKEILDK